MNIYPDLGLAQEIVTTIPPAVEVGHRLSDYNVEFAAGEAGMCNWQDGTIILGINLLSPDRHLELWDELLHEMIHREQRESIPDFQAYHAAREKELARLFRNQPAKCHEYYCVTNKYEIMPYAYTDATRRLRDRKNFRNQGPVSPFCLERMRLCGLSDKESLPIIDEYQRNFDEYMQGIPLRTPEALLYGGA